MSTVLVNFSSRYHTAIAQRLRDKGVDIGWIFALENYQDGGPEPEGFIPYADDPRFSETAILPIHDFQYPKRVISLNADTQTVLSKEIIEEFHQAELLFMRNSDRLAAVAVSASTRRWIYHELLRYFYEMFSNGRIDCVVFSVSPHVGFDNVLYAVAKHFSIPTYLVEITLIDNRSIVITDYQSFYPVPPRYLQGKDNGDIIAQLDPAIHKAVFGDQAQSKILTYEKKKKCQN